MLPSNVIRKIVGYDSIKFNSYAFIEGFTKIPFLVKQHQPTRDKIWAALKAQYLALWLDSYVLLGSQTLNSEL